MLFDRYCESTQCRHRLFSDYFGDDPPRCVNRCDCCKNPKQVQKRIEQYHMLTSNSNLKGFIDYDADTSSLYGGGRNGVKAYEREYQEGSSDSEGSINTLKDKQDRLEIIKKQFALRKSLNMIEMEPTPVSRVKYALSTSTKVSGLSVAAREKLLTLIADNLKQNYLCCRGSDTKVPDGLVYKDFEDIAIELEYSAFTNNKGISLYRRDIAKHITELKFLTKENIIFADFRNYVPKKKNEYGGDSTTTLKNYKASANISGSEFVTARDMVEKTTSVIKTKRSGLKKETLQQTSLNSFFKSSKETIVKDEIVVNTETIDSSSSSSATSKDTIEYRNATPPIIKEEKVSYIFDEISQSPTELVIAEEESSNNLKSSKLKQNRTEFDSKRKRSFQEELFGCDDSNNKTNLELPKKIKIEESLEKLKNVVNQSLLKPPGKTETNVEYDSITNKKPTVSLTVKLEEYTKRNEIKTKTADMVVKILMPFYKQGQIRGKDTFKSLARHISHKNYGKGMSLC